MDTYSYFGETLMVEKSNEGEILSPSEIEELNQIFTLLRTLKGLSREQATAELALRLTDPEYVKFTSNVTPDEVEAIAEEFVIAQRYRHARHLTDYATEELILRCSCNGWRARQQENIVIEGKRAEKVGFFSKFMQRFQGKREGIEIEDRRVEF